jgi:hypothetical protein
MHLIVLSCLVRELGRILYALPQIAENSSVPLQSASVCFIVYSPAFRSREQHRYGHYLVKFKRSRSQYKVICLFNYFVLSFYHCLEDFLLKNHNIVQSVGILNYSFLLSSFIYKALCRLSSYLVITAWSQQA